MKNSPPHPWNLKISIIASLTLATLATQSSFPAEAVAQKHPPINIHPELYLGWEKPLKPPEIKKLPWLLEINLRCVAPDGRVIAGPLKINTREEFAGASFGEAELPPPSPIDTNSAVAVKAEENIALQALDFATQVTHDGANLINLRCYVRLRNIKDRRVATHQTTATLECRPGRETVLAEFPDLKLLLTANWHGPVLSE